MNSTDRNRALSALYGDTDDQIRDELKDPNSEVSQFLDFVADRIRKCFGKKRDWTQERYRQVDPDFADFMVEEEKRRDEMRGRVSQLTAHVIELKEQQKWSEALRVAELGLSLAEKLSTEDDLFETCCANVYNLKIPGAGVNDPYVGTTADWQTVTSEYKKGQVRAGKILGMHEWGISVELGSGVVGNLYLSGLSDHDLQDPRTIVTKNQEIEVVIIDVLKGDPPIIRLARTGTEASKVWLLWDDIEERYKVGTAVAGKVLKKKSWGVIVALDNADIVGEVYHSELRDHYGVSTDWGSERKEIEIGDRIELIVLQVSQRLRKIRLGRKGTDGTRYWLNQEGKWTWNEFRTVVLFVVLGMIALGGQGFIFVFYPSSLFGLFLFSLWSALWSAVALYFGGWWPRRIKPLRRKGRRPNDQMDSSKKIQ